MQSDVLLTSPRLSQAVETAVETLLAARNSDGYWTGELSSSALSTATAITALSIVQRESGIALQSAIDHGLRWLAAHANEDGGWGDTLLSLSNLSTTTLAWAAFGAVPGADEAYRPTVAAAEKWLLAQTGSLRADQLAPALIARYGKDRTFSVPILTLCALAGRLGAGPEAWRRVIALPFELASFPHRCFALLRLPVVSYALPALIAIGLARHHHLPSRDPVTRWLRKRARPRVLKVLAAIQPANGGFLEATPLTSFVTMSLAGSGEPHHPVTRRGAAFLVSAQRPDGSWPIDTNLATWLTTLSVNALGASRIGGSGGADALRAWLLGQQYRKVHPYTHAGPGGWAWTHLPGGVPDADDTAGALLALRTLGPVAAQDREAAAAGLSWLAGLQNSDGGIPTFCRGWGALPFDRSSSDITAHAVRAWLAWRAEVSPALRSRLERASGRALAFLCRAQRADGSWVPLWFGNQFAAGEENPTYGTSRVLDAFHACSIDSTLEPAAASAEAKGIRWLLAAQRPDGGWGSGGATPASVEETALAVECLARRLQPGSPVSPDETPMRSAVERGARWLVEKVETGEWRMPSPIGFYFARLWYFERLYPLIFTVAALREAERCPGTSFTPRVRG